MIEQFLVAMKKQRIKSSQIFKGAKRMVTLTKLKCDLFFGDPAADSLLVGAALMPQEQAGIKN